MKHQALHTIQAKLKFAITGKIITFLLFGSDTLWRIPRKRVARGGKFWSPETLLYPIISNHSVFAMLEKKLLFFNICETWSEVMREALVKEAAEYNLVSDI